MGKAQQGAAVQQDRNGSGIVDAVVIGRNEGARLIAGLGALAGQVRRIVYVDSGSTDGSLEAARARGALGVALDLALPFTAARARNAGLAMVADLPDPPKFVLMVDGDCAVRDGWVAAACAFLEADPDVAAVCGRRRERFPGASLYNLLCDLEWDTPVGPARACGGDALIRFAAIRGIGGYCDAVIAAEDDEMCQRLRAAGGKIWRMDAEMAWHDAAIMRFGQWWRRSVRAGHGFADVGARHPPYFAAERQRVLIWGGALPVVALLGLWVWPPVALMVVMLYAASFLRVAWRFARRGLTARQAAGCAALITLSKFPNLQGMALYAWRKRAGRAARIIEYK